MSGLAGGALTFALLSAVAVGSAVMMITRKNPVHSALYLLVTLFAVAGVYVVLHAEFLAAVQVLVYAGGIMVLFIFVIMLVEAPEPPQRSRRRLVHVVASGSLVALVTVLLGAHLLGRGPAAEASTAALGVYGGNLETVAMALFRDYLFPFELVSVLLLVAMVGAIVLARAK